MTDVDALGADTLSLLVEDIRIAYQVSGAAHPGIPLVLLMGYGCSMDMWPREVIATFSRERPVFVFDHRGMGWSEGGDSSRFSIPQFAQDAANLIRGLGLAKVHLLGWSMGAMIALECAAAYPDLVDRLFLYSCFYSNTPLIQNPGNWERLTDLSGTLQERTQRMFANLFPARWIGGNPNPGRNFPKITAPVRNESLRLQAEALKDWRGIEAGLPNVRAQTWIITGTEDIVIPASYSVRLGEALPQSTVIQIPETGHGLMYQDPGAFISAIRPHLI